MESDSLKAISGYFTIRNRLLRASVVKVLRKRHGSGEKLACLLSFLAGARTDQWQMSMSVHSTDPQA